MNNDLISRDDLRENIERIKQNVEEWVNHTECDTTKALVRISLYDEFIDLIDNAPTVEPPKQLVLRARDDAELEQVKTAWGKGEINFTPIVAWIERTQGEWKRHDEWRNGEYIGGFYHVNCPNENGYYSKWTTNYCPNCGAKMKGGVK